MASSLRERRRMALHDEILQAARSLIQEKGYAAMSMDDLAAHVGISKPTLYSYFATKEDLVAEAFIRAAERLFTYVETEIAHCSPRERLLMILRIMIHDGGDEQVVASRPFSPDIFRILCGNQQCLDYMQRVEGLIAALFREAMEQGEIDSSLHPRAMALAFFGLVHAARAAPFFLCTADPAVLEQTILTFFERGIQA
jgi:AcrR family transcriptional regulator